MFEIRFGLGNYCETSGGPMARKHVAALKGPQYWGFIRNPRSPLYDLEGTYG